jgi:hypothetical protein
MTYYKSNESYFGAVYKFFKPSKSSIEYLKDSGQNFYDVSTSLQSVADSTMKTDTKKCLHNAAGGIDNVINFFGIVAVANVVSPIFQSSLLTTASKILSTTIYNYPIVTIGAFVALSMNEGRDELLSNIQHTAKAFEDTAFGLCNAGYAGFAFAHESIGLIADGINNVIEESTNILGKDFEMSLDW